MQLYAAGFNLKFQPLVTTCIFRPTWSYRDFVATDERDVDVAKDVFIFLAEPREERIIGAGLSLQTFELFVYFGALLKQLAQKAFQEIFLQVSLCQS